MNDVEMHLSLPPFFLSVQELELWSANQWDKEKDANDNTFYMHPKHTLQQKFLVSLVDQEVVCRVRVVEKKKEKKKMMMMYSLLP